MARIMKTRHHLRLLGLATLVVGADYRLVDQQACSAAGADSSILRSRNSNQS